MALAFEDEEERELVPLGRPPQRAARAPRPAPLPSRRRLSPEARRTPLQFAFGTRVGRVLLGLGLVAVLAGAWLSWHSITAFLAHDPHFVLSSADAIEVTGTAELPSSDLQQIFGADLGRSVFLVPLAVRQHALEQLPWVAQATVMRLLPDHLRVAVVERTPVAFARLGSAVELVDSEGVLLHLDPAALATRHYSFPVVAGLSATDSAPMRAERMHLYGKLMAELRAAGPAANTAISEVDLADLEDVRVSVPAAGRDLLLDLGDTDLRARFKLFEAHLPEWREQYPELSEVDLRYDREVVLKMADGAVTRASNVPPRGSLTAAPEPETAPRGTVKHAPAGHGRAHGWRPL